MKQKRTVLCLIAFLLAFSVPTIAAEISLSSLLDEMINRDAITKFPEPAYTCKQASSYDRNAKSLTDNWFANADTAQFIRDETNSGRKEWVLMDQQGPGAIVRWWITAPHYKVNFRIYIDGKDTPEITANIGELVGGKFLVGEPLSARRANGMNLYLPIPYAKSIKITVDDMPVQGNLYYQINYRTYTDGTKVDSFTMGNFKSLADKIAFVQTELLHSQVKLNSQAVVYQLSKGGGKQTIAEITDIPVEIESFAVKVDAEDIPQALRSVLVKISFDGNQTVRVPLGDFFGGGVGINPYKSWYNTVEKDGTLRSFWRMPFKKDIEVELTNYDPDQEVQITISDVAVKNIQWTDQTMYFYANWRQERDIQSVAGYGTKDWNYIALKGKGVFVGDSLSVVNRDPAWWGEGDEKIYTDGETFPSHFGTGTEDYYGYAWCTPEFFESPFHAQPRAEGPNNYGNTTNNRVRLLDGIPFTKDFRFDMEVWHWAATSIDYSVVTYWYGFPGIEPMEVPSGKFPTDEQVIDEVKSEAIYELPFVIKITGFDIADKPTGGQVSRQTLNEHKDGKWVDDDHLWWTGTKPGDKLRLNVELEKSGKQKLICDMTKAVDYGQFQFYLDDKKIGGIIDLYNANAVINSGSVIIGTIDAEKGKHVLTVEVVGKHPDSYGTMFGLDKYRFE